MCRIGRWAWSVQRQQSPVSDLGKGSDRDFCVGPVLNSVEGSSQQICLRGNGHTTLVAGVSRPDYVMGATQGVGAVMIVISFSSERSACAVVGHRC